MSRVEHEVGCFWRFIETIQSGEISVLATSTTAPGKTVPELLAAAKSNPGKLTYASPGMGSYPNVALEYFIDQQFGRFADTPNVLNAGCIGEAKIAIKAAPNIVTVQHVGVSARLK